MSKFADVLLVFSILIIILIAVMRFTSFSELVVGQDFGFALICIAAISCSLGLCIKAEYDLGSGDLKGSLISLGVFGFLVFFLDLIFTMGYLFNNVSQPLLGYIYLVVTAPAFIFLSRDLRGKQWFGT